MALLMIVLIAFSGATTLVDDSQAFQTYSTLYRRGQGEQATSTSVFALGLYIRLPELRSPYQVPPEICLIGSGSSMNAFQQGVANARRISQGIIDSPISTEHSKTFVALVGS